MNNQYDNKNFFDEYAKMPRSREGLKAARRAPQFSKR